MTIQPRDVRPSPIAGKWYPGNAAQLAQSIDAYIAQAVVPAINGRLIGLLVPHAGHRYSGPVAGYAYKLLQGQARDVVALIGPSHYPYPASLVTTAHAAYRTPLGDVSVDHDLLHALQQTVEMSAVRSDPEHSLEIELPFLQRTLGDFRLLPLAMVDQTLSTVQNLGHALASVLQGQNALLVASSDLSHFYPQELAEALDTHLLAAVSAYDPAAVIKAEEDGTGFACGRGAIAAVMIAAQELGADTALLLNYATSGKVSGDFNQVVGYGAAVFFQAN